MKKRIDIIIDSVNKLRGYVVIENEQIKGIEYKNILYLSNDDLMSKINYKILVIKDKQIVETLNNGGYTARLPEPQKESLHITISPFLMNKIKQDAIRNNKNVTSIVTDILNQYYNN